MKMPRHRFIWFIAIIGFLAFVASSTAQPSAARAGKTYRNPVIERLGPADPHVIQHEGRFYLYPTTDGKGYDVFVSHDLVHWEQKPNVSTIRAAARGRVGAGQPPDPGITRPAGV